MVRGGPLGEAVFFLQVLGYLLHFPPLSLVTADVLYVLPSFNRTRPRRLARHTVRTKLCTNQ